MKTLTRLKKLAKLFACFLAALFLYLLVVVLCCRTPKTSYWIDDPTYGQTPYFHFETRKGIEWSNSLPVAPPQPSTANSFRLAIVELDEYGDFFQSQSDHSRSEDFQLQCAKQMLRDASAADQKPVLLFLFVHGWRHDAAPDNENLKGFRQMLEYVAESKWGTNQFAVCGVYVGWRGASIRTRGWLTWLPEMLSFWSRKSVAEKIASTPASSALFGLTDVARVSTPDRTNRPSSTVLAGHSLGAGILMNSVAQALAYEFGRATSSGTNLGPTSASLQSPASLILLLNPAFESVYLRQLRTTVQTTNQGVYPWLISLTSETDMATKYVFPLAQYLRFSSDSREQPYREEDWSGWPGGPDPATLGPQAEVPQSIYARNTPGHNFHMRDYHIVIETNSTAKIEELQAKGVDPYEIVECGSSWGSMWKYFLLKGDDGASAFGYLKLVRPTNRIHSLFNVATVDSRIMDGHGLPFDKGQRQSNFMATIMTILNTSRVEDQTKPPEVQLNYVPTQSTRKDIQPPR